MSSLHKHLCWFKARGGAEPGQGGLGLVAHPWIAQRWIPGAVLTSSSPGGFVVVPHLSLLSMLALGVPELHHEPWAGNKTENYPGWDWAAPSVRVQTLYHIEGIKCLPAPCCKAAWEQPWTCTWDVQGQPEAEWDAGWVLCFFNSLVEAELLKPLQDLLCPSTALLISVFVLWLVFPGISLLTNMTSDNSSFLQVSK